MAFRLSSGVARTAGWLPSISARAWQIRRGGLGIGLPSALLLQRYLKKRVSMVSGVFRIPVRPKEGLPCIKISSQTYHYLLSQYQWSW
jgi:hypothetical protein